MSTAQTPEAPRRLVIAPLLRLARVLWRVLPMAGLVVAGLFAAWVFEASEEALTQVAIISIAFLVYAVAAATMREVLSPDRPWLRLLPLSDSRARRLDLALRSVLFFLTVSTIGIYLVQRNGWNEGIADLLRVVRNVVVVAALAIVARTSALFRWLRTREADSLPSTLARYGARVVFPVAVLALLVFAAARGLGYHPLAAWVLHSAGGSVLKILGAVLLFRALRRALYRSVRFYATDEADSVGEATDALEASPYALGFARVIAGLLKIALVVLTFPWVLDSWSLSTGIVADAMDQRIVAAEAVTWGDLAKGAWRVALTLCFGWLIRSILTYFVFPRSNASVGARYAILAMLRYTVGGLAIVFGLVAFGVNAGSLGWFFGAAGIGLAFGLQDIIGNFVSGLIMLVERPIRVGDIVEVGQTMGNVEEIRMRGTVLRTFDNTTILIPNSQMLGERVTNMTHGMAHARIKVGLLVPHDADPALVESILLAAAAGHPDVLDDPAPFVWFTEFSPSSLDFMLVCFTHQLRGRIGIASRMRFDIIERLRGEGIEIPFPQQEVHLRGELPGQA
ncbi:MAG: mechanosensitive ion channel [Planctomycetota bacterium]|nr:mechanosensitive ion channel [Planctomycetota bacterium]